MPFARCRLSCACLCRHAVPTGLARCWKNTFYLPSRTCSFWVDSPSVIVSSAASVSFQQNSLQTQHESCWSDPWHVEDVQRSLPSCSCHWAQRRIVFYAGLRLNAATGFEQCFGKNMGEYPLKLSYTCEVRQAVQIKFGMATQCLCQQGLTRK